MPITVTLIIFDREETQKHQYTYCTQLAILTLVLLKYLVEEAVM
jgi:hypothetical protein